MRRHNLRDEPRPHFVYRVEHLGERTARLILEVRAERLARFEAVAA